MHAFLFKTLYHGSVNIAASTSPYDLIALRTVEYGAVHLSLIDVCLSMKT